MVPVTGDGDQLARTPPSSANLHSARPQGCRRVTTVPGSSTLSATVNAKIKNDGRCVKAVASHRRASSGRGYDAVQAHLQLMRRTGQGHVGRGRRCPEVVPAALCSLRARQDAAGGRQGRHVKGPHSRLMPAAQPGVAIWAQPVFPAKKPGSSWATRTEFCDVLPGWQAPCALGVLDQDVRCCGLAQVEELQRTKMLLEDGPGHRKKGRGGPVGAGEA